MVQHSKLGFCEECILWKKIKISFSFGEHKAKDILEYVYTDVLGPSPYYNDPGSHTFLLKWDM